MQRKTTLGTILGVALLLVGSAALGLGATGTVAPATDATPAMQDNETGNETMGNETAGDETMGNETNVTEMGNETQVENASVTFLNQTTNGTVVLVNRTALPEGGFIAIHLANKTSPGNFSVGPVIGNSSYLEPGVHEDVYVELNETINESQWLIAMPHMDTNDNQVYEFPGEDDPYTVDGPIPVTDEAYVEVMADAPLNVTEEVAVTDVTVTNETDDAEMDNETAMAENETGIAENETAEMGNETTDNETEA